MKDPLLRIVPSLPFKSPLIGTLISGLGLLFGCHQPSGRSGLQGHYEGRNEEQLKPFDGMQTVIPEHAPSQGVVMSLAMFTEHHLENMALELLRTGIKSLWVVVPLDYSPKSEARDLQQLYQLVGIDKQKIKLIKPQYQGQLREWARDWAPLTARIHSGPQNNKLRLLDFNYYSDRPADDSIPTTLAGTMGLDRVSVPVYNEGGNFMNNSRGDCLMTDRVLKANDKVEIPGDMILTDTQVKDYYQRFAGCRRTVIFPSMPHEGTRHIDLWAKFLNDQTVIVNEISDDLLPLATYQPEAQKKTLDVKKYLDARAQDLHGMGYQVVRIPMPLPFFGPSFNLFRSYSNSLILNGTVLIPQYRLPHMPEDGIDGQYVDHTFIDQYEVAVNAAHKAAGLKVVMIPSDQLIAKGGAIHCTTMQIAE